jgi:hypothetical protein
MFSPRLAMFKADSHDEYALVPEPPTPKEAPPV